MLTCMFLAVFCADPDYNSAQIAYLEARRPGYTYIENGEVHMVFELNTPQKPEKLGDILELQKESGDILTLRYVPYERNEFGIMNSHVYMEENEFNEFKKLQPGRFFTSTRGDAMFGLWSLIISIGFILAVYQLRLLPPKIPEEHAYRRALGRGAVCGVINLALYFVLLLATAPQLTRFESLFTLSAAVMLPIAPALYVVFRTKKVMRYNYSPT